MGSRENATTAATTITTTTTIPATTSPSDFVAIQDYSYFSYISSLSPIKPVKAAPVVPGFPGLGSSPIVFTSPRLNPHRETSYLKRPRCRQLSEQDVRGKKITIVSNEIEKSNTQGSNALAHCIEKSNIRLLCYVVLESSLFAIFCKRHMTVLLILRARVIAKVDQMMMLMLMFRGQIGSIKARLR